MWVRYICVWCFITLEEENGRAASGPSPPWDFTVMVPWTGSSTLRSLLPFTLSTKLEPSVWSLILWWVGWWGDFRIMVKSMGCGFRSQLQLLLTAWRWANYLTSLLSLSFLQFSAISQSEKNVCTEDLDSSKDLVNVNTMACGDGDEEEQTERTDIHSPSSSPTDQSRRSIHFVS